MMFSRAAVGTALAILALTLLGYLQFPGHTFLQADTLIYVPILEHFWDHTVLDRELLARDPHVSFTIYDETALALRRVSGLDFRAVLLGEQFVFRALGLLGVYLIATALGLRRLHALLVTAVFSLGAVVGGPAVLTIEYEPVPRGFAVPLLLLATGLTAHARYLAAGTAASLAFLYHPPTVLPFWAVYFTLALLPAKPGLMGRRILGLAPMLAGVVVLLILSRLQQGISEPQDFFGRLSPGLEQLQRMRASYNWLSLWPDAWLWQYPLLFCISLGAYWRLRRDIPAELRLFLLGLPLAGLLSMPLSYLLLEKLKWDVIPQLQPARAVLFIVVAAIILATAAAIQAAARRRFWESVLWLLPVYALPVNGQLLSLGLRRLLLVIGLAVLVSFAAWAVAETRRWAAAPWAAAVVLPAFLIPAWGQVKNYPALHNTDLDRLASWARTETPKDAVFLFPAPGKSLVPAVFRAEALRAVYVDWKSGGQVNFLRNFAKGWWSRWQAASQPESADRLNVDYVVVAAGKRIPGRVPVFEDRTFVVYKKASGRE